MSREGVNAEDRDRVISGLQATPISLSLLPSNEQALLAYADVLTLTPAAVTRDHIQTLHAAGYDDRAIHDACAIIGYFAFVNRIADGLGVQVERQPEAP